MGKGRPDLGEILTFNLPKKGATARGYLSADALVVLEGSTVAPTTAEQMPKKYLKLRQELISKGIISRNADGDLAFTREYISSVAACVIEGGSRNGYDCWKDAAGQSLKQRGLSR